MRRLGTPIEFRYETYTTGYWYPVNAHNTTALTDWIGGPAFRVKPCTSSQIVTTKAKNSGASN